MLEINSALLSWKLIPPGRLFKLGINSTCCQAGPTYIDIKLEEMNEKGLKEWNFYESFIQFLCSSVPVSLWYYWMIFNYIFLLFNKTTNYIFALMFIINVLVLLEKKIKLILNFIGNFLNFSTIVFKSIDGEWGWEILTWT
jgi:hypothetical protein